jgi:hypothetical protein
VTSFGNLPAYGGPSGDLINARLTGMAAAPDGKGYWLVAADGGIFNYGDAGFFGSDGGSTTFFPYVGIAATPSGQGYWITNTSGTTGHFGDAADEGSLGTLGINPAAPIVGIAATAGVGYWLVAADGGVFGLGDAAFYGSMGGKVVNAPVVGMARTPDGNGYWLVAADGGVFSFGDAAFYGSLGASPPAATTPVVGMAGDSSGDGYWLTTTDKALPSAPPVPSVLNECNVPTAGPAVTPVAIVLACGDANASLVDLTWSSRTSSSATATGKYTRNTCVPNCALGTFVTSQAVIRLAYPIETGVGPEFASVSYLYADASAPGGSSGATVVIPTSPG